MTFGRNLFDPSTITIMNIIEFFFRNQRIYVNEDATYGNSLLRNYFASSEFHIVRQDGEEWYVNGEKCSKEQWELAIDINKSKPFFLSDEESSINTNIIFCIFENGVIKQYDSIMDLMGGLECLSSLPGHLALHCSYDLSFNASFIYLLELTTKGEIDRIGKTKFIIHSEEQNHCCTPHFHVIDTDENYSFYFNGEQMAGQKLRKRTLKNLKSFLSMPNVQDALRNEWNRNNQNIQINYSP